MKEQTMQQAAAHYFGIAWDELGQFEQAHWEAAYRAVGACDKGQAAEAGKWGELKRLAEGDSSSDWSGSKAYEFMAVANPAAVLELIAERDELLDYKRHMVQLRELDGFDSWAAVLVTVDQLKAENERLKADMKDALGKKTLADQAVIEIAAARDQLKAENERLKVDNGSMRGSTKRMGEDTSKMQRQLRKLQRECDQLKAENEALRGSLASAEGVLEGDLASTYRDLVNGRDVGGELYEDIQRLRAALGVQA